MLTLRSQARSRVVKNLPNQLYIQVTNYCNSLCTSCPLTYNQFLPYEAKRHSSWEDFRRIVDQFPHLERAVLHGIGEPLLDKDLPRFVAHLKERHLAGVWLADIQFVDVNADPLSVRGV